MKKDTKNKELLDKMIAEAKSLQKTRDNWQMKLWKEMLKQLPECSDAWFQIKSIVSTAEFVRDHSKYIEIGCFEQEDAPLVVQMLKNMCWQYNNKKVKHGWMLDVVLGMSEYGVTKFRAIGILRCALQIGVLREWFWEEDDNAMFVPSMLDTPITANISYELADEYENTFLECIGQDCDILETEKLLDFFEKYIKDVPDEKLHGEITQKR